MALSQHQSTSVSVVIVNYRSWDKLAACLDSLLKTNTDNIKLEIIVVDNCSDDEKLDAFAAQYPSINFILNSGNHGFAHGCNTGAKASNSEYLFFLNPDTEVPTQLFSYLIDGLNKLPAFSIIATQKLSAKGKAERVERFLPRWYTLTGIGKAAHRFCIRSQLKQNFALDKEVVYPEWVSGSVIFMRSKAYKKLNGWNESYWMYSEDVDLCKRAANSDGKIALLQNVAIIHNHGGSSRINPVTSALTKSEVYISRHIYIAQHFNKKNVFVIQGLLTVKTLIKTGLIAFLSILAFNHPKAQVSRQLFKNLISYYTHALVNKTWLSPRSVLYKK
ncbi:glycosyltransferase family 2 protein [Paraglaciecola aquimarina]|uniref:Glycosyltransferase family 2 protein n=1 Tax=Paraglaciecola algarum TaxID=3050085 RepID=A0ABS9D5H0_9ALTE|nr:glycosyltransferase family 2 protein [Paraglaciecola sp. G1-23]MCF2947273.1 glycosyltransferase family 2 protein [Paraglaciecola sp. G1-23]